MTELYAPYLRIREEVDAAVDEVIAQAAFINGPAVARFAEGLADYLGARHVVPCGNGTDALVLALTAAGVSPGDEVILPAFTFGATAQAVLLTGGTPVLADVDPATFNLDPASVERLVGPRTRAIVPVHLFGCCADMEAIMRLAAERNIRVVEDNAQSLGAQHVASDGTRRAAGLVGDIGCTSFFPTKNLGCFGDGGAVYTDDDALAARVRSIANHGQRGRKYYSEERGFNSRLDTIQAAVLNVKLPRLDEYIGARRRAAAWYRCRLEDVAGIELPCEPAYCRHTYNQYTLKIAGGRRDRVRERLAGAGISSTVYYPWPLYRQPAFGGVCRCDGLMHVAPALSECVLSLPMHTELTERQVDRVAACVKRAME